MAKLSFSGHETFSCKIYWLKKGYDFVKAGKKFTDEDAVVDLGVGKNMVTSIRFWLKAFGLTDEQDHLTEFANFIFSDENGVDAYLEDPLTLWLLHYQIVKNDKASIYNLIFNRFRRERLEFNRTHLKQFVNRVCAEQDVAFSPKTIDADIKVFFSNYLSQDSADIEDAYANVLQELGLINVSKQLDSDDNLVDIFRFQLTPKNIPIEAILYVLLDKSETTTSIGLSSLANDPNQLGNIFLITESALTDLLKTIPSEFAVFSETAGNQVLQLNSNLKSFDILQQYYNNEQYN